MSTALIESLVAGATPVRRLRASWLRAAQWLAFATIMLVVFSLSHSFRYNIEHCLRAPLWLAMCIGAVTTAALAAVAALELGVPGRSRLWALLPLPTLAVWTSAIVTRERWIDTSRDALGWPGIADCLATVVLIGVPLGIAMTIMLRRAAVLQPALTAMLGGIAVAGVVSAALHIFHPLHATLWLVLSNAGVAALFAGLGLLLAPRLLAPTAR